MQASCPVIGHPSLYMAEQEAAPAEPPVAKRSNSSSPKKARTSQVRSCCTVLTWMQPKAQKTRAVGLKKPLTAHNSRTSFVLDCSAP